MRSSCYVLAILAVLASAGSPQSTQACDQCTAKGTKCRSCCDDRGLLDGVDSLFGQMQAKTKKMFGGDSKSKACDHGAHSPSCSCQAAPTCKCQSAPRCGCKKEPSCGCESPQACQCDANRSHRINDTQTPIYPTQQPTPIYPTQQPKPVYPNQQPNPAPIPRSVPQPIVPPPILDRLNDPFQDDTASRPKRIPAAPVQYSRPKTTYGQAYDPQASSGNRIRFNDSAELAKPTSPRETLATTQSSRRSAITLSFNDNDVLGEDQPNVISASGTQLTPVTSQAAPLQRVERFSSATNPLRP